jgi:hypothetical protein
MALQVNQRVTVGIRPEFFHLSENQVENTIQCQVANMVDSISSVECYFKVLEVVATRHWLEAVMMQKESPPGKSAMSICIRIT